RNFHHYARSSASRALQCRRSGFGETKNRRAWGCGKDAWRKSPKADFPATLGNPAPSAGFPLSHSLGGWRLNLNRTFHLLLKPDILICYQHRGRKGLKIVGKSNLAAFRRERSGALRPYP